MEQFKHLIPLYSLGLGFLLFVLIYTVVSKFIYKEHYRLLGNLGGSYTNEDNGLGRSRHLFRDDDRVGKFRDHRYDRHHRRTHFLGQKHYFN